MSSDKILFAMDMAALMSVEQIAADSNNSTDNALVSFMESQTGQMLYDDSTKLWWDGPSAIVDEYNKEISKKTL